jgi:hypothetical protein
MKLFKTWTFAWWEVALLKMGLISFGILATFYFYEYLAGLRMLWWALFGITALYFLVRVFRD